MDSIRVIIASNNLNPTVARLHTLIPSVVKTEPFDAENQLVLRWGAHFAIKNAKSCLNSATAVKRTRKKLRMLDMFRDDGVIVPRETNSVPCVARWNKGSRGEGIRFCKTAEEKQKASDEGAGAFLEWIPIKKEYRVHVFRGLLISICEKQRTKQAHKYIRSASHGWKFCEDAKLRMTDAIDLVSSSIAAVRALKLDFGAVDIAMSKSNTPVVFEVNTAPGLNDDRAKTYAKAIRKWLDSVQ